MLEFNQNHKVIDSSAIKSKTEKARKTGKVMVYGILLSGVLLLSGCRKNKEEQPIITSTAIIMENGNAMIVDLQSYEHSSVDYRDEKMWFLYTSTGDRLLVDFTSVQFIDGENSHEKAETIAQALIGENGQLTCYDEVQSYGKTR